MAHETRFKPPIVQGPAGAAGKTIIQNFRSRVNGKRCARLCAIVLHAHDLQKRASVQAALQEGWAWNRAPAKCV